MYSLPVKHYVAQSHRILVIALKEHDMKHRIARLLFLLCPSLLFAQDNLIVANASGHADYTKEYRDVVAQTASKNVRVDEAKLVRDAKQKFPTLPQPVRGEFETQSDYSKRLEALRRKNEQIIRLREQFATSTKQQIAEIQTESRQLQEKAKQLADRDFEYFFVASRTTAPRYDMDTKQFGQFTFSNTRLGEAEYGIADLLYSVDQETLDCDVETAKQIRSASDAGNLIAFVRLRKANVRIVAGSVTVERSALEMIGDSLAQSAPEIGIAILAELISPGSTKGVHIPPKEVDKKRTVPKLSVSITGKRAEIYKLCDLKSKEDLYVIGK